MRKLLLIARSNMRKAKGQTAAIIVLILISALLLNLWLMLSMDYHANFDRYHDALNAEHVTLAVDGNDEEIQAFLDETLKSEEGISEYGLTDCLLAVSTFDYNGGSMSCDVIFTDKQTALERNIGKVEIVEEGNFKSGIYLPMLYKSDEIDIGKPFEMTVGSHTVKYTVCGFLNSVMLGSHNCALTQFILTEDKYSELVDSGFAYNTTLCSIRLNDKSESLSYEASLKAAVSAQFPNVRILSNSYDMVSQSRYISQMIASGIMSAMAFLVLLIALVVIASNIVNYIQVNMKNLGALKAVGYTSRQLICSLLMQFLSVTLIAALVGAGLSYCLFPAVNSLMISQTGIPYAMKFLPLPILISVIILGGAVALAVWLSSLKIRKVEPIAALRSGISTHNFKRNHVPLEKTKAPLNLALALKTTLSGVKHNITVFVTVIVLTLVMTFSGLMEANVIADFTPFLNLIVGETADSSINVESDAEDEFLESLNTDSRVEKAYLYNSVNVSHVDGAELMATLTDDFSKVNNQSVVFEGRFPKYGNEIALAAKYAGEKGFEVGDEIEITANGKTEKYLISGLTQVSNNLGRDCLLTREGYEKLGEISNATYYINLAEGVDIDAFNEEMQTKFTSDVNAVINVQSIMDAAAGVYITLMTIIVIAILILSVIIITFVLYLLVRTMLNNKWKDYGILKSLGFTSKQLIVQTALSFMPAMIIATVVGLIVSGFVINPLLALFLSGLGIVKCTFKVPILFMVISGIALVGLSFGIACLLSLKIKKLAPRNLLVGE